MVPKKNPPRDGGVLAGQPLSMRPARANAAQRALQLPEIVSTLFQIIHTGPYNVSCMQNATKRYLAEIDILFQCSLVNKLWYSEAARLIWIEPQSMTYTVTFPDLFAAIPAHRRQFYADFVEEVTYHSPNEEETAKHNELFKDVIFPRLKSICVMLDWESCIPKLDCPNLQELDLDPRHECYPEMWVVTQDRTDIILNQVATLYPKVPSISFIDQCIAFPGTMQKFKDRMGSSLKHLDYTAVIESADTNFGW
ncbi:hypothetical protein KVT40_008784 [Elsinoe batatas]|uniref:Uncharacterized protein n=1 Tax=Elsinoe batatas TaxID=2601811 RepID=A0A8K0KWC0_9PEZI|nr:hypothetical protein KVT40_008784 [Elsinoe batatas]